MPHAFGGTFPTADLGPGQVSLFTGEFQYAASDVKEVGLELGRSHLSMAGDYVGGPSGVFGPGWVSDIVSDGGASLTVVDRTGTDGSLTLASPSGESYVYRHESGTRGALRTGTYLPVGEHSTDNDRLTLAEGSNGRTFTLTLTQADQTTTRWATKTTVASWSAEAPASFWVEEVSGPGDDSTTAYAADSEGRTTWIFNPAPAGVTCNTTVREAGCRALELEYTGSGTSTRLVRAWMHLWDPDKVGGAGMDRIAVAQYAYSGGKLVEAWDPRISPALKTKYTYSGTADRPRLESVTEPGLKPWRIEYDGAGKVAEIVRERPSGTDAVWTVDFSIGLNEPDDGYPNLSPTAAGVLSWGQTNPADQPNDGAAVFGPGIPSGISTAERNQFAALHYFTANGRLTNTAEFGAGRWQIATTGYDSLGNVISELSPAARLKVLEEGPESASQYSSLTVYNEAREAEADEPALDAGIRTEQVYGPMHEVMTNSGDLIVARSLVETDYDDEVDGASRPGRPSDIPDGGFNLPVRERTSTTTELTPDPSPTRIDTQTVRYEYAPVEAGDGNGWELSTPTQTVVGAGTSVESATVSRFDSEGTVFQTRTPQGVDDDDPTRWTDTVNYTADSSAARPECRDKPEWVGLECWSGPASQPTGGDIPETLVTSYSAWLSPTRTVELVDGNERRVATTNYDEAGRPRSSQLTTPGVSDTDVSVVTTSYDVDTGLPSTGIQGDQRSTAYDSWGRITSETDANGNTSKTTYDSAGRIDTVDDGKGTSTFHYNGTDASGAEERRGLVTRLETGASGAEATTSFDADGNLVAQKVGGVTSTWAYDVSGYARRVVHDLGEAGQVAYSRVANTGGQTRQEQQVSSAQDYAYDARGRLTRVEESRVVDRDGELVDQCFTRAYEFTLDSNRTKLTEYDPNGSDNCQSSTAANTTLRTFDNADRASRDGYTYDQLGRTLTVPAADLSGGSASVTVGYHANDMVRSLASGDHAQTYDLDPIGRISAISASISGEELSQTINHYADSGDSPAWSSFRTRGATDDPWTETWTRYIPGPVGGLSFTDDDQNVARLQLGNLDGDITTIWDLTGPDADTATSFTEATEYGLPVPGTGSRRYGWLGTHQRDTSSALGGLTLMGVRLYNPATGRFLSRDPVPGGNDNTYIYPPDPVNQYDLTGKWCILGVGTTCTRYAKDYLGRSFHATAAKRKYIKKHDLTWGFVKSAVRHAFKSWNAGNTTQYQVRVYKNRCVVSSGGYRCTTVGSLIVRISIRFRKSGEGLEYTGLRTAYCEGYPGRCPSWVKTARF